MAKKKKSSRRSAKKKMSFADRLWSVWDGLWGGLAAVLSSRAANWTGSLLTIALLVAGGIWGVPELRAHVRTGQWADAIDVDFDDRPAWVTDDLHDLLVLTTKREISGDVFDQTGLAAARERLEATGWFQQVVQIRRDAPTHVTVVADFVHPTAVIRDREGDHLVDADGRLLPRMFAHDDAKRQTVIRGAHFDRPTRWGVRREGGDVSAAMEILAVIDDRPWRHQIAQIDTARYLSDGELTIQTDLGAEIVWGSAPGDEQGLEVLAHRKLAYLDKAFEEFERIDTGYKGTLRFYEQGYFAE